jgi:hypothetical protein
MTEDEKRILEEEFQKAGSVPALLEAMARSESKEFRHLKEQIEQGPDHPTGDELYNYVLGWLDRKESLLVMDHLVLCGRCLREVIRIRRLEEALTQDALARADRVPWLERIKGLISKVSFPVSIDTPALEAVRGLRREDTPGTVKQGDALRLIVQAPADGHVAVFHYSHEASEARLVFPCCASDQTRVIGDQKASIVEGEVEGPAGLQLFKIIWTKEQLIDPLQINWADPAVVNEAVQEFFSKLEGLIPDEEWQETAYEYQVVQS